MGLNFREALVKFEGLLEEGVPSTMPPLVNGCVLLKEDPIYWEKMGLDPDALYEHWLFVDRRGIDISFTTPAPLSEDINMLIEVATFLDERARSIMGPRIWTTC
ncbi:unnamed protein product [marine sediment metagenome]|uniref:Uncharacterized protein n=1 Tax=marine sediment metagenome TaxID=412755 RepID=X0WPX9_9ZZZZ